MRTYSLVCGLILFSLSVQAQQRIKVMHYNLLQFGNPCNVQVSTKLSWLNTVLSVYKPDIFTVNEVAPSESIFIGIRDQGFSYTDEIEYGEFSNAANSTIINGIFYNTSLFEYKDMDVIGGGTRDMNAYEFEYKGPGASQMETTKLYCIVAHFKASNDESDRQQRRREANEIMNWIFQNAEEENVLVLGDFNIKVASEPAFQTLVFNSDTDIRLVDPISKTDNWAGSSNAIYHTQSTRDNTPDCGVPGGLDDRFDMILMNPVLSRGNKNLSYVKDSYEVLGNTGISYNTSLRCDGNGLPMVICNNLRLISDHLPVVMELQVENPSATSVKRAVQELPGLAVSIQENPFQETLTLQVESKDPTLGPYQLAIRSLTGQTLSTHTFSAQTQTHEFSFSSYPSGVYILSIQDTSGNYLYRKLVKQ